MTKKKNKAQRAWGWLDGRKTNVGMLLAVLYLGAVSQGLMQRNDGVEYLITAVLGVGLGHKVWKR